MIDVNLDELRRSFHRQEAQAREMKDDYARWMLLFYSVECGCKHLLLKGKNIPVYSRLTEKERLGHDIRSLLKSIGIQQRLEFPKLKTAHGEQADVKDYHEIWRYGINFRDKEKLGKQIEESLQKAVSLLQEQEARRR